MPLAPAVVEQENYPLPPPNGFCKLIVIVNWFNDIQYRHYRDTELDTLRMRSSWPEGRREVTQYGQSKPKLVSCYSLHSALSYAVRPDCLSQQCFIVTERAERRELCTNISNSWILFNACQFWRCVVSTRLIINSCHLAVIKISFDKSWYSVRSMIMPFWLSYGYGAHFALYGH